MAATIFLRMNPIFSKFWTFCQQSFRELYYIWYYNFLRLEENAATGENGF